MDDRPGVVRLVVVSAGTGNPSSTRQLSDRVAQRSLDLLGELGLEATVRVVELAPLAVDTARAAVAGFPPKPASPRSSSSRPLTPSSPPLRSTRQA